MTYRLTGILMLLSLQLFGQGASQYFEKIRNNEAKLTAFFAQMPKGGDLHHHYSGSVYAETYLDYVIRQNYFVNEFTLEVKDKLRSTDSGFTPFDSLKNNRSFGKLKQRILEKWSVKDYNGVSYPSDKQFFETFDNFNVASKNTFDEGLLELKHRAIAERVSYIETMFTSIPCEMDKDSLFASLNEKLNKLSSQRDTALASVLLRQLHQGLDRKVMDDAVQKFNQELHERHARLKLDDDNFAIRYQNYIVRAIPNPSYIFKNLLVAFQSANESDLIVGVNIVAPEDNEVSMRDYWLHMQMFKYCQALFPKVKYAMHAGELTMMQVKPEELTWHINAAVYEAGAYRIGHGIDIPHEAGAYDLLRFMAKHNIAVEINLVSNEFILKVKNDKHPLMLYKDFGVPIVISTDDAGVLRSNMTQQYVLLAKRYKEIDYSDIKQFVFNSIDYSFIEDIRLKAKLRKDLEKRFDEFELMFD